MSAGVVPLARLHGADRDDARPAFVHHGRVIDYAGLRADVRALVCDLQADGARDWALYHDDAYPFTVALLAVLAMGGCAWLPSNATAGTEASLTAYCDGWLGPEWSAGRSIPVATDCGAAALPALSGRIMVFTSGSTGEPQPIPKTLAQFDREVEALERLWGGTLGDARILATVSHQHIYGLLFRVWWPLAAGRTAYSERFSEARDLLAAVAAESGAVWVASPAHLRRLQQDHLPWDRAAGHLRMIFSSGGPLPPDAAAECARFSGVWPTEIYGSSESGGIAWRTQADANAWWQPLPAVDVRAAADGALELRSPHLADGGPLTLNDSIECAADGRFRLGERLDRIVKVEGKRLSLSELEAALQSHPWIAEARALLLRRRRESIAAVVVPTADGALELERLGRHPFTRRLREALLAHFEPVTVPRLWRFPDTLPVNAQGKVSERELRELFETAAPRRLPQTLAIDGDRQSCEARLLVPDDLGCFEGHFPGRPVVPGVVLIGWAEHVARHHFAVTGEVRDVERIKFSRPVQPGHELVLRLVHDDVRHCIGYRFRSARGDEEFASGRLVFADAPGP